MAPKVKKVEHSPVKEKPPANDEGSGSSSSDDEEDEEAREWWERENLQFVGKGERRWETLEHNGVLFAEEYTPLGVPIIYNGAKIKLTPEEEEAAVYFCSMKEHSLYKKDTFRKNFFADWKAILDKRGPHPIKVLELVDFEDLYQAQLAVKEKKKNRSKEEKKDDKKTQEATVAPYKHCLWDGKKQEVANYRTEQPGCFRGRGEHPKTGMIKKRVQPEDITINIGETAKVPDAPAGHKWGAVIHDHNVTWLASWTDQVTGAYKYVMLGSNSAVKGMSDMMKFEKARKVKSIIAQVRDSYREGFESKDRSIRQRSVCAYFIDKLALRVGNEKGNDEADTVGCCSLKVGNVTPQDGNKLYFNFLGKDSITFENTVEVDPMVYRLIVEFRRNKKPSDELFDEVTTTRLNDYFKDFMPGLTAKVFRTYNASICLQQYFKDHPMPKNLKEPEKLIYFNNANTQVALLCNHQRSVPKGHAAKVAEMDSKIQHVRDLVKRLEAIKASGLHGDRAAKRFFDEEDAIQYDWLEKYGKPEQKAEYDEFVKARGNRARGSAPTVATKADTKTTTKQATSSKTESKTATSKAANTKTAKRAREEESSDDELLSAVVEKGAKKGTSPPPKKATKPEPPKPAPKGKAAAKKPEPPAKQPAKAAPKKKGSKAKDDSDDDVCLGDL